MSWAAHELESYFIQKHTKARISYLAILLGGLLAISPAHRAWSLDAWIRPRLAARRVPAAARVGSPSSLTSRAAPAVSHTGCALMCL